MDIDGIFRDAAPDPGPGAAERIARAVMARLERRRRRARALRRGGLAAAAAAAVAVTLIALGRPAPPDVPAAARVVAPEAPPPPVPSAQPAGRPATARKGWRKTPPRPVEAAAAKPPAARDPADDLRDRVDRAARRGDRDRLRALAGDVCRSRPPDAWPLLARVIEALGPDAAAIEAAGDLGDPRAVPYLERALHLADPRATLAADALRGIPGHGSLAALLEAGERMRGAEGALLPEVRSRIDAALRAREDEVLALLPAAGPASPPRLLRTLADLRTPDSLAAVVEALERPALRPLARRLLARTAGRDLGAEPARWRRWLATEAFGPARPGADARRLEARGEIPIAAARRSTVPGRRNV